MQSIEIFKAGTHTAMDGRALSFTEADLAASAAAYDPAVHEAPIVIGHPKNDDPAYGWVSSLSADKGLLAAEAHQVEPAFAELVRAGRYKHKSAAFYPPDHPQNPKPGVWYLKHVGFLGAQPPAVKGLKPAAFADGEAGIVEFSDGWTMGVVARLFTGLREWMIGQFGQEKTDQVLPRWELEQIQRDAIAEQVRPADGPAPAMPAYAEPPTPEKESPPVADPKDRSAEFAERENTLAQREAAIAARERALRAADDAAFVDGLVQDGRLLPANRDRTLAFMAHLDATATVEFGEAGAMTPVAAFRELLKAQPKAVALRRIATGGSAEDAGEQDAHSLARAAVEFQEAEAKAGRTVTTAQAVAHIVANRDQART